MNYKVKYFIKNPSKIFVSLLSRTNKFKFLRDLSAYFPITFKMWWKQKVMGHNKYAYWPTHHSSKVVGPENILVGVGSNPGLNSNVYVQGSGKLIIGNYSTFGQGSGILSGGHSVYDHRILTTDYETKIGDYCWIGMNCIILPGVELGDFTIVAAGAIVTKSFPKGHCIIAGNPAKVIKELDKTKCIRFTYENKYHGYIPQNEFEEYRKKHLCV
jgi:acetyltransferase-like isoleucine patch superfamily enzyme